MKIKLIKPTQCAQDVHETTKYPRPWFKPKPKLQQVRFWKWIKSGKISMVNIIAVYCLKKIKLIPFHGTTFQ